MNKDGVFLQFENIRENLPLEKLKKQSLRRISKFAENKTLRIHIVQSGSEFEGIAWGTVSTVPINAYCRSSSISKVIQSLESQIKRQYKKREKRLVSPLTCKPASLPTLAASS